MGSTIRAHEKVNDRSVVPNVNGLPGFVKEYHARTGRWATIYSTTDWWTTCTGNSGAFAANDPLFPSSAP
jgi:hypothetical protein